MPISIAESHLVLQGEQIFSLCCRQKPHRMAGLDLFHAGGCRGDRAEQFAAEHLLAGARWI